MIIKLLSYTFEEDVLRKMNDGRRNQLFGCMHAHNELTFLNRLLLFSMTPTADGEIHDQAQSVQMWCLLQLLAGKLHETWVMLAKRISLAKHQDPIANALCPSHQNSLIWLRDYFTSKGAKERSIMLVRNKTAFHYEGLDLGQSVNNLADRENTIHIAQHPANILYFVGSAAVFRTLFVMIADKAHPNSRRSHAERVGEGFRILQGDVKAANWHLHQLLYGLIKGLTEEALGGELGEAREVTSITAAPRPEQIGLPPWLCIAPASGDGA